MTKKVKFKNKKIIENILSFFVIIVLIYIAALLLFEQTPNITGIKPYTVVTNSMEPTIKVGDLVLINTRNGNHQEGDIIAFHQDITGDGNLDVVIHYIANRDGEAIQTMSENNQIDPWVINDDAVIGTYMMHIPNLGNILRFARSPIGIAVIVIDIILIYVIFKILWPKKSVKA